MQIFERHLKKYPPLISYNFNCSGKVIIDKAFFLSSYKNYFINLNKCYLKFQNINSQPQKFLYLLEIL
jgi:hypothetical protein